MANTDTMLREKRAKREDALRAFDSLAPVTTEFMTGRWKGFEIATGHPIDGLLQLSGWYGKLFKSKDEVHPLLFYASNKTELYAVNPKLVPITIKFPKSGMLSALMMLSRPILQTKAPKARMRMVEYRGRVTGTMAY